MSVELKSKPRLISLIQASTSSLSIEVLAAWWCIGVWTEIEDPNKAMK